MRSDTSLQIEALLDAVQIGSLPHLSHDVLRLDPEHSPIVAAAKAILNVLPKSTFSASSIDQQLEAKKDRYENFLQLLYNEKVLLGPSMNPNSIAALLDFLYSLASLTALRRAENLARERAASGNERDVAEAAEREELARGAFALAAEALRAAQPELRSIPREDAQLVYSQVTSAGPALAAAWASVASSDAASALDARRFASLEHTAELVNEWAIGGEAEVAALEASRAARLPRIVREQGLVPWLYSREARAPRLSLIRALLRVAAEAQARNPPFLPRALRLAVRHAEGLLQCHVAIMDTLAPPGSSSAAAAPELQPALAAFFADRTEVLGGLWDQIQTFQATEGELVAASAMSDSATRPLQEEIADRAADVESLAVTFRADSVLVSILLPEGNEGSEAGSRARRRLLELMAILPGEDRLATPRFADAVFGTLLGRGAERLLMSLLPDASDLEGREALDSELLAAHGLEGASDRLDRLLLEFLRRASPSRPDLVGLQQLKLGQYAGARETLLGVWRGLLLGTGGEVAMGDVERYLRLAKLCAKAAPLDPNEVIDDDYLAANQAAAEEASRGLRVLQAHQAAGVGPSDPLPSGHECVERLLAEAEGKRTGPALKALILCLELGAAFAQDHVSHIARVFSLLALDVGTWVHLADRRHRGLFSDEAYREALSRTDLGRALGLAYGGGGAVGEPGSGPLSHIFPLPGAAESVRSSAAARGDGKEALEALLAIWGMEAEGEGGEGME